MSGAFVQVCCGAFLFGAETKYYEQMAMVVTCTSAISFLVTVIFFASMLHICGPMKRCGDILYACRDKSADDEDDDFDI